ncbi:MAG TPA: alpha/beta hydrolase, partial [Anaerolineales bacterium]|nr:alpha/beta hydrolase [Anaerolineales bacterium]
MPEIEVNGIELNYEVSGQGQPIFFIHGLGSAGRDWEYQVDYFAQHYQVITYDVRGHGKSAKPRGPYSVPLFAADAASLIKALKIEPVHVVGISMGGMIAFQLAVSAPELLRSLIIVNSAPELVVKTLAERIQLLQRLLIVRLFGMRQMGQVLSRRLLPKEEHAPLRRLFVQRWAENDRR